MDLNKPLLRKKFKADRLNIPLEVRLRKSNQICQCLLKLDIWNVSFVHVFMPITNLGEVDIKYFIQELIKVRPDIRIYTSTINSEQNLAPLKLYNLTDPVKFDVIIVPMLAFDLRLHRIGYGGGFYDRLLKKQTKAVKVGVCFEIGKTEVLPVEPHDKVLDYVITEKDVYTL